MVSIKKIMVLLLVVTLALVSTAMVDNSDAAVNFDSVPHVTSEFTDMNSGVLSVSLKNDSSSAATVDIIVTESGTDNVLCTKTDVSIPGRSESDLGKYTCELSWSFGSSGHKYVNVEVYNGSEVIRNDSIEIQVAHSIWKDATTYLVIVFVIIVIVIAVFLKIRGVPGSKKDKEDDKPKGKIFTQMEEEKAAKKAASSTASVEKQTYDPSDSKRKSKRKN